MRGVFYVFGILDETDIEWLLRVGTRRAVAKGTVLIEQGRRVDAVYIVLDGNFSVSIASPSTGRPARTLAALGCGEMVGELSFLDARPPAGTVRAIDAAVVLSVPRTDLTQKLLEDLPFASRWYHALGLVLAHRLRNIDKVAYGDGQSLSDETTYDDELDPDMLDAVGLAEVRFDYLLKRARAH